MFQLVQQLISNVLSSYRVFAPTLTAQDALCFVQRCRHRMHLLDFRAKEPNPQPGAEGTLIPIVQKGPADLLVEWSKGNTSVIKDYSTHPAQPTSVVECHKNLERCS